MNMRKFTVMTLAAAMTVSMLPATAFAAEPISVWHTYCGGDPKAESFAEKLNAFLEANPDVELEIEEVNSAMDSMGTKITTALTANDLPDVYWFWGGFTLEPVLEEDLLMDVQEYLDKTENFKKEEISDAAWDYYTVNGKIVGFPLEGYYPSWVCNKAIFEEYNLEFPETMEDVKEIAATLNENGIIPLAVGSSGGNPGHFLLSDLMHQYEGGTDEIRSFGDTHQFATDNMTSVAQVILDLKEAGVFPQDTVANGDWTPCFELYNSGKAAMTYTYNWALAGLSDEMHENTVLIDTPQIEGTAVDTSTFVQSSGNYGFVVTKEAWENPEKQDSLVKFIDFMLSDDTSQAMADNGVVTVKTTGITYSNPIMKELDEYYAGRTRVPAHFNTSLYSDGWSEVLIACDELFAGNVTAEEFVEDVQEAYDEAYEEAQE